MEKMHNNSLKIQNYFTNEELKSSDKKTIFKYRTRMERFGENYRGGNSPIPCPLCKLHLDNQEMSFQCPEIIKEVTINGSISDIYKENIKIETVDTVIRISEYRKRKLGYKKLVKRKEKINA